MKMTTLLPVGQPWACLIGASSHTLRCKRAITVVSDHDARQSGGEIALGTDAGVISH